MHSWATGGWVAADIIRPRGGARVAKGYRVQRTRLRVYRFRVRLGRKFTLVDLVHCIWYIAHNLSGRRT